MTLGTSNSFAVNFLTAMQVCSDWSLYELIMDAHNNLYMEKADSAKQKENEDREKIINFLRKNDCWLELGCTCG